MSSPRARTPDPQHWVAFTLAVMSGWLVVASGLLVSRGLFELAVTGSVDWCSHVVAVMGNWGLSATVTPFVIWIARRFPLERGRMPASLAVQGAVLAIGPAVHVLLRQAWMEWLTLMPSSVESYLASIPKAIVEMIGMGIPPYLVDLGAANGWYYFQRYVDQTRQAAALEVERVRLQALLTEARLEALQAQLQPHFLFNALHALSTLILKGEQRTANEMLANISRYLRMTLDHAESPVVPLAVELEFLEAYRSIQRARFGDHLAITVSVDPGARAQAVPRLIFQPLVENAIHHGLATGTGSGRIEVRAGLESGRLTLEVEDNGRGLPAGDVPVERIGLRNIRQRLEQLYPGTHAFAIGPGPGGGVLARIVIPAICAPTGDGDTRDADD